MTEEDKTPWWKKPWVWLSTAVVVVVGIVGFIVTLGRRPVRPDRPRGLKPNPRPKTPDVVIPKAADVNTDVADDFQENKDKAEDVKDVVSDLNSRFD